MNEFDWKAFLSRWGGDMLAAPIGGDLPAKAHAAGWLGFPPATEEQIAATEARLQIPLPPSYKAFLRTSNGWLRTTHAIERVRGVQDVEWFRKRNREWIAAYTKPLGFGAPEKTPDEQYFAYGEFAADFRPEHLKEALQISEVGDAAVYLLNPQVITKDGEWEAWFFANWLPGVHRYRSFQEMMLAEYHQFAGGGEWTQPVGVVGELPDEYAGSPGSAKRKLKKRTRPRVPKVFGKPYDRWTVEELLEMLRNPDFDVVYGEVIRGLTLLADPRAVPPLVAMLEKGECVGSTAAALQKLAPDLVADRLLALLTDPRNVHFMTAATMLADMECERAIPSLVALLCDTRVEVAYNADLIGQVIASFGDAGYEALLKGVGHADSVVRRRASRSLMYTDQPEARSVAERLCSDPDPEVRENVRIALQVMPPPRRAAR